MQKPLSWPIRIAAVTIAVGVFYPLAEEFFPGLRKGAPKAVSRTCSELAVGESVAKVSSLAKAMGLELNLAGANGYVKVRAGCVCAFDIEEGKVVRHEALCNG